jgi:hypothetical protein
MEVSRLARYDTVSSSLALLSDRRLAALVAAAPVVGSGIGGTAVSTHVDGVPVFVKQIPLTDLERRPEHLRCTANLFDLPTFYQYGVGSTGFGVWRELAAHIMTTNWVLGGRCASFPLLYHWRVLPEPPPVAQDRIGLDRMVDYWDGSAAVRGRLEAIERSTASVALFLEHVPQNLVQYLAARVADGTVGSACAMVERELRAGVSFMNSNGLLHFDAHFRNVLTDGRRLYFTDFGLTASPRFELSPAESAFLARHRDYDRVLTTTWLVNWLTAAVGPDPVGIPAAAEIITRYRPVAAVINDFFQRLRDSRTAPYPADEIRRACAAVVDPAGRRSYGG